jgi:hypothetical protein
MEGETGKRDADVALTLQREWMRDGPKSDETGDLTRKDKRIAITIDGINGINECMAVKVKSRRYRIDRLRGDPRSDRRRNRVPRQKAEQMR